MPAGLNLTDAQANILHSAFRVPHFKNVPGLCKAATLKEIEAQGWSLNPGRYVGVAESEARELEERIGENVARLLDSAD